MCKDHDQETVVCKETITQGQAALRLASIAAGFYGIWRLGGFALIGGLFGLVVAICIFNTLRVKSPQLSAAEVAKVEAEADRDAFERISARADEMAERLGAAIRFPTVSFDKFDDAGNENKWDDRPMRGLHAFLQKEFPLVHKHLKRSVVNTYSLVYEWTGTDSGQKPWLLCAHMDVVPTPEADKWAEPPFSGTVKQGQIHGRGAIDDKHALLGIFEAVEDLLKSGFRPKRSIFIACGHDEEVGGHEGAAHISKFFTERKIHFEFVLDEGLFILDGVVPGHKKRIAMVCVAEKGYMSVRLTTQAEAGHSSAPTKVQALGVLGAALGRLMVKPVPSRFATGPSRALFEYLKAGFSLPMRIVMCNLWLFHPLVSRIMANRHTTAPTIRTTTALTIVKGGVKSNVLPSTATAVVNHRIHPLDTLESVLAHDRSVIADKRVKMEIIESLLPSPVSDHKSQSFQAIHHSVVEVFKGVVVAPAMMVGNTDTRHYWTNADQIYRFSPTELHQTQIPMFHGFNERITVANHTRVVLFFRALALRADRISCPVK